VVVVKFRHDGEADAVYIGLSDVPYAYGIDLDDVRRIDYAADGTPVGVELLCVNGGVDLEGLPSADRIEQVLASNGIDTYRMRLVAGALAGIVFDVNLIARPPDPEAPFGELAAKEEVTA